MSNPGHLPFEDDSQEAQSPAPVPPPRPKTQRSPGAVPPPRPNTQRSPTAVPPPRPGTQTAADPGTPPEKKPPSAVIEIKPIERPGPAKLTDFLSAKKILGFLGLMLVLAGMGLGIKWLRSTTPWDTKEPGRYVDRNRFYSIMVPDTWEQDFIDEGKSVCWSNPAASDCIIVSIGRNMGGPKSEPRTFIEILLQLHGHRYGEVKLEAVESLPLVDGTAYRFRGAYRDSAGQCEAVGLVTSGGMDAYLVVCSSLTDDFEAAEPIYDLALKSFRVK